MNRTGTRMARRIQDALRQQECRRIAAFDLPAREAAAAAGVPVAVIYAYRRNLRKRAAMFDNGPMFPPPPPRRGVPDDKVQAALEARAAGTSYRVIARDLDLSEAAVRDMVIHELQRLDADESATLQTARRLELERLDALLHAIWNRALDIADPDQFAAFDRVMKLMDRRAKMLGLDAPTRINIEQRLRKVAQESGLDEDEVLAEARAILEEIGS